MISGFRIDEHGHPTSTVTWVPAILNEDGEVVGRNPQPENTVFPDDFDTIFANMQGPADDRLRYKFKNKNKYTTEPDPAVAAWRKERRAKLRDELGEV